MSAGIHDGNDGRREVFAKRKPHPDRQGGNRVDAHATIEQSAQNIDDQHHQHGGSTDEPGLRGELRILGNVEYSTTDETEQSEPGKQNGQALTQSCRLQKVRHGQNPEALVRGRNRPLLLLFPFPCRAF